MTRKSTAVRREEIVDAAMAVLADPAGGRFTTRRLADRVGLTEGAIFRHFASLDAVLQKVVARVERLLFAGFPPDDADPVARVGSFFRARVRVLRGHPDLPRLLLSDGLAGIAGEAAARRLESARRRTQAFLRTALREAEAKGILAERVPVDAAAVLVTGALLALVRPGGAAPAAAEEVWAVLEGTLRGAPGGRR